MPSSEMAAGAQGDMASPEPYAAWKAVVVKEHAAPEDPLQLNLLVNDLVVVVEESAGWGGGYKMGQEEATGWFPMHCVKPWTQPSEEVERASAESTQEVLPTAAGGDVVERQGLGRDNGVPPERAASAEQLQPPPPAQQQAAQQAPEVPSAAPSAMSTAEVKEARQEPTPAVAQRSDGQAELAAERKLNMLQQELSLEHDRANAAQQEVSRLMRRLDASQEECRQAKRREELLEARIAELQAGVQQAHAVAKASERARAAEEEHRFKADREVEALRSEVQRLKVALDIAEEKRRQAEDMLRHHRPEREEPEALHPRCFAEVDEVPRTMPAKPQATAVEDIHHAPELSTSAVMHPETPSLMGSTTSLASVSQLVAAYSASAPPPFGARSPPQVHSSGRSCDLKGAREEEEEEAPRAGSVRAQIRALEERVTLQRQSSRGPCPGRDGSFSARSGGGGGGFWGRRSGPATVLRGPADSHPRPSAPPTPWQLHRSATAAAHLQSPATAPRPTTLSKEGFEPQLGMSPLTRASTGSLAPATAPAGTSAGRPW